MKRTKTRSGGVDLFRRAANAARKVFRPGPARHILLACAAYAAWTLGASYALQKYFALLFRRLGLTAQNVASAPRWAILLVNSYGAVVSLMANLGGAALATLLYRRFAKESPPRFRRKALLAGLALGALAALLPAGVFLLADSVRVAGVYSPSAGWFLMLPVYAAAALAEDLFCRALAFDLTKRRWGPAVGCLFSCAALFCVSGGWTLTWTGMLNLLLTGLVCCALREKAGPGASWAFRAAWSWISALVIRFPGGEAGPRALVELYSVSDAALTGGSGGLINGLFLTFLLAGALLLGVTPRLLKMRRGRA